MRCLSIVGKSLLGFAYLSTTAFGGHGRGNGIDYSMFTENNAWFTGAEEISYCVIAEHGAEEIVPTIVEEFKSSVKTWAQYVERKKVKYHDEDIKLNFNFAHVDSCVGNEHLTIHFTEKNPNPINEGKTKLWPLHPMAEAKVTSEMNPESGLARGTIWINSTYAELQTDKDRLHGVLLHELGHVYGNLHVDGTIMSHEFIFDVTSKEIPPAILKYKMRNIDHSRELKFCLMKCSQKIEGRINFPGTSDPHNQFVKKGYEMWAGFTFKRLTGREPQGKTWASLKIGAGDFLGGKKVEYRFGDSKVEYKVEVDLNWLSGLIVSNENFTRFKIAKPLPAEGEWTFGSFGYQGQVVQGRFKSPVGELIRVNLELNVSPGAPVVMTSMLSQKGSEHEMRRFLFFPMNHWDGDITPDLR